MTIEERLRTAAAERDALARRVAELEAAATAAAGEHQATTEALAAAQAREAELQAQATAAQAERDAARTSAAEWQAQATAALAERDEAQATVARLETLCGVRGLDRTQAAPGLEAGAGGEEPAAQTRALEEQLVAERDPRKRFELAAQLNRLAGK